MRKNARKYLYVTLFLLVLTAIPAFGANQVGRTIEKSLKDALVKTGMQNTLAVAPFLTIEIRRFRNSTMISPGRVLCSIIVSPCFLVFWWTCCR